MAVRTAGRRIGGNGMPVDGSGFDYESDGPIAALLAQRNSPVVSQPITGEWVFGIVSAQETGGDYERGVGLFPPGNAGPPEHIHPAYAEHFEIVQGEFLFKIDGKERHAHAGERLVVPKGTPHTFRNAGAGIGAVVVETRPAARTGEVITTLFGMAHEGALTPAGQPGLLHALTVASEYADDTIFTSPPPAIAIPLAKLLAPLARMLGYRSTDPKYQAESFWNAHVEQPQDGWRAPASPRQIVAPGAHAGD